jgi:diguanylate cyclase (GGDEF)-like protein
MTTESQTYTRETLAKQAAIYLSKRSRAFLLALGIMLVLFMGCIDVLIGTELSFSIFYLLPISLVTWFAGRRSGILISLISAATWFSADLVGGTIYSSSLIPYWNTAVRLGFFLITTYLLSVFKAKLDREEDLAKLDPLTKVANRRHFYDLAEMEVRRSLRYERPLTIAYIDVDDFKKVNDRFGHHTGDALLTLVASTVQKNLRETDSIARLGGDEFAILLPETGRQSTQEVISRLHRLLSEAMQKKEWPVTFSIGAMTFIRPPAAVDEMIKRVDDLMYAAKRQGKNIVKHEVSG